MLETHMRSSICDQPLGFQKNVECARNSRRLLKEKGLALLRLGITVSGIKVCGPGQCRATVPIVPRHLLVEGCTLGCISGRCATLSSSLPCSPFLFLLLSLGTSIGPKMPSHFYGPHVETGSHRFSARSRTLVHTQVRGHSSTIFWKAVF